MVYLSNINLNQNELQNARIQNLATDPATPVTGQIWYNTATAELKYYNGTAVKVVPYDTPATSGAPTTATVGKVGQLYLDTATGDLYVCTAAVTTPTPSYTWNKLSSAAGTVPAKPDGTHDLITTSNKIDMVYIPESIIGQMEYKGTFDASTGATITGLEKGWYYIASVAGNKNPDGTAAAEAYAVKDWAIYNGTAWDKLDNTDAVTMVNSQLGNVETYKGAWTASTAYYKGDIVKNGVLYVCNTSHTSGATFDATEEANWEICGRTYTASAGITLDGTEFKHTNSVTAQTTEAVYPVKIDAQGHISSYGSAVTILKKFVGTITGDATTTAFAVTHNLGVQDVNVEIYDSSNEKVMVDVALTSTTVATVTFAAAPTASTTYKVVVIG